MPYFVEVVSRLGFFRLIPPPHTPRLLIPPTSAKDEVLPTCRTRQMTSAKDPYTFPSLFGELHAAGPDQGHPGYVLSPGTLPLSPRHWLKGKRPIHVQIRIGHLHPPALLCATAAGCDSRFQPAPQHYHNPTLAHRLGKRRVRDGTKL